MAPFAWSCLACEATNAAGTDRCSRCGCPARATRVQVDAARAAYRQRAGLPPLIPFDRLALARQVPWLPIAAVVLLLLGWLMLAAGTGGSAIALGGLLIALAALCASSYRAPPR
jgi:hypothetical protein